MDGAQIETQTETKGTAAALILMLVDELRRPTGAGCLEEYPDPLSPGRAFWMQPLSHRGVAFDPVIIDAARSRGLLAEDTGECGRRRIRLRAGADVERAIAELEIEHMRAKAAARGRSLQLT